MFTDLTFVDVNFTLDITKDKVLEADRCFWFTLPIAVYKVEGGDDARTVYEYLSFPLPGKTEEHTRFFSFPQPYYWNHDYMGELKGSLEE